MLSLERLRAFSVKKGCYPGQEIVARTHFLGQAKRGLVLFEADAPVAVGSEVRDGERVLGTVVSAEGPPGVGGVAAGARSGRASRRRCRLAANDHCSAVSPADRARQLPRRRDGVATSRSDQACASSSAAATISSSDGITRNAAPASGVYVSAPTTRLNGRAP